MRVRCVGAVVRDPAGRLLVVRRGQPPAQGTWSLPGGRVEAGESDREALSREVREETGLLVDVGALVGVVELAGPAGVTYDVRDYSCTPTGGALVAGSDAAEARWVSADQLRELVCSPGLADVLTEWGVLEPAVGCSRTPKHPAG